MIPKDIMEKVWSNLTVKEYIMRTLIEGRRRTHVDGQTVLCGERLPSSRPSIWFASYGNYVNPLDGGSTQVDFTQLFG